MRIGIYDPYLDDIGGGEKYMMTIAQILSVNDDVAVFWDTKEDVEEVRKRFALNLSRVSIVPNIFSSKILPVQRYLATKKYDAIVVLTDGSIPLVASKKLFLHIQQPLKQMQIHSFFDNIKLSRVKAFFCNSEFTRSYIEKKFDIKTLVIYPPVVLSPQHAEKENVIVHVGRFRSVNGMDYKKQSIMIQAFKEMVDKGLKQWKFVVATSVHTKDMNVFEKMKTTAKGYPVEFLINQSNIALWSTYSQAKIYWHASGFGEDLEKNPELAEHFGISTVEAMGAGAVPVVINAGGQREIVKNDVNGLLWNTLEELKSKTLQLIGDAKLWEKLSRNARQSAQQYSEEQFSEKIRELIRA